MKYPNYQIVVIDNGSTDDSVAILEAWKKLLSFHLMTLSKNIGYPGAINVAIKHIISQDLTTEYVFLLNPDAHPHQEVLNECVKVALAQNCPCVGTVVVEHEAGVRIAAGAKFPHLLFFSHSLPVKEGCDFWEVDIVHGAAILLRRDVIEDSLNSRGYVFDPALFLYGDEVEFCSWLRRRGHRIMVAGRAIVHHYKHNKSTLRKALAYYYVIRNHISLARKLLPQRFYLMFHIWCIARFIQAVLLFIKGQRICPMAIFEGLIDGYRLKMGKWDKHEDLMKIATCLPDQENNRNCLRA